MSKEYISTIVLPNDETVYYVKDSEAQEGLAGKITNPASKTNGQYLKYNGINWIADDLEDTGVISVASGDNVIGVSGTKNVTVSSKITATQGNVTLSKENDGLKANIADNALTIAKTSGLQAALNGKEDSSNKVTAISASSTDAQYPSAKAVYTNIEDVRAVAEGKTATYVINAKSDIAGTYDATNDQYTNVTAITGVTLADLRIGDNILIKQIDVADYWVSALTGTNGICLNKLETTKVDLTPYAKTEDLGDLAFKDDASAQYTPSGSISTPTITVTPTTTTVNSITDVGTLPTFEQGDDVFTQGSFTQGAFSQGTLPTWTTQVNAEVLSFTFSAGTLPTHASDSFVKPTYTQGSDTFTQGTLPTKSANTTVATGIQSATSSQPTFTGDTDTITVA